MDGADVSGGKCVFFALTDVVGSTRLWESAPASMQRSLRRHDAVIAEMVARHGGSLVKSKGEGDSTFSVFSSARGAVLCMLDVARALAAEEWPEGARIAVRAAVHGGPAEEHGGDYFGPTVNRCARLRTAAHGGQVLVSGTVADELRGVLPAEVELLDLGEHHLKDLSEPEHIFQLCHPELQLSFPALDTVELVANNLPSDPVPLIGRAGELQRGHHLLSTSRFVTITGPGGTGKSRLAAQLATERMGRHPDGVWFVELAGIRSPDLVASVIGSTMGAREEPSRDPLGSLVRVIGDRRVLLVLDGCDHVLGGVAEFWVVAQRACPRVTVVATTREAVGLRDEATLALLGLSLSPSGEGDTWAAAVQLFVERCRRVREDLRLEPGDLKVVAEICQRVDGMPLAIELAAARARTLSFAEIADRLDDQLRLLSGGGRDAPPHHRTLRALMDWSYESLTWEEQTLFRGVTMLAGTFSLEAAEAIAAATSLDPLDVIDLLERLVSKSLVIAEPAHGAVRYRVLSTIKEYGRNLCVDGAEKALVMDAAREHFIALARETNKHLQGPEQRQWLDALETEHDNFRMVLHHTLVDTTSEPGASLACALWRFWYVRGHLNEGRLWLALAGAAADDSRLRSEVRHASGTLAWAQGDYETAVRLLEQARDLRCDLGDAALAAETLVNLGMVSIYAGNYDLALTYLDEGVACATHAGHHHGLARALTNLGYLARLRGDLDRAREHLLRAMALLDRLGDRASTTIVQANLAAVARENGDVDAARRTLTEALSVAEDLHADAHVPVLLAGLSTVTRLDGYLGEALRLAERAAELARRRHDVRTLCQALIEIGLVASVEGRPDEGRVVLERAAATAGAAGDQHLLAASHAALAQLAAASDDCAGVDEHANAALRIRRRLGEERGIEECERFLAELHHAPGVAQR